MRHTNLPYDRSAHGPLYTVKQVTEKLQCGKTFVYDLVREEILDSVRLGAVKGIRIPVKSVDKYLRNLKKDDPEQDK